MKIYSSYNKIQIESLLLLFTREEAQKLCLELELMQNKSKECLIFETVDEDGKFKKCLTIKKYIK